MILDLKGLSFVLRVGLESRPLSVEKRAMKYHIVIIKFKLLMLYPKADRKATAYSRALRYIRMDFHRLMSCSVLSPNAIDTKHCREDEGEIKSFK